jgi:hypothetical protein
MGSLTSHNSISLKCLSRGWLYFFYVRPKRRLTFHLTARRYIPEDNWQTQCLRLYCHYIVFCSIWGSHSGDAVYSGRHASFRFRSCFAPVACDFGEHDFTSRKSARHVCSFCLKTRFVHFRYIHTPSCIRVWLPRREPKCALVNGEF